MGRLEQYQRHIDPVAPPGDAAEAAFIPGDAGFELRNMMMVRVLRTSGRFRYHTPAVSPPYPGRALAGDAHLTRLLQLSHRPPLRIHRPRTGIR